MHITFRDRAIEQRALPHCYSVQMMEGQSHYGCLLKAAPLICAISAEP